MINLKNVTIIAVSCIRSERTLNAMRFSTKNIDFGSSKILTCDDISDDKIDIVKIDKLDYIAYNHFIVYNLFKYVETEYALIIQDDGFVVNPYSWKDEFLNYDYIGAPWEIPCDDYSYRDFFGNIVRVGNGGFSLRSKKLLELPTKMNLEWKPYFGFYNEDGFITCHNRHLLEKEGCKFAGVDVAKYFSHEKQIPENFGIEPFGFHGKESKYNLLIG